MIRPCQHARAVSASSAGELAWLDIFGRNAPTIKQFQFPRQILPTLLLTPPPSLLASIPLLHHHREHIPILIAGDPYHRNHPRFRLHYHHHHHHHQQQWGLSPKLYLMRPHIHLTHRPGRSLANPSYRDW
ncbi:unnamed protein product [Schistocephalus solidus]|uniref:Uncharacterized protein n=1 Tax=Schistocephalus solidus TaxID=70667 RepID=A0A183SWL6_SCHSO|nr:unnamed protein product [Schistocephalus solidus]